MLTICFANDFWPSVPKTLPDCPYPCELLFDRDRVADADVVVFHIPTLWSAPGFRKRRAQKWVAWSMESDVNYPRLADPAFMRQFDLTMTYRRDSDVWTPYFDVSILEGLSTPPEVKSEVAPAVYFASNDRDRSGRRDYVAALMEHLSVDSYGRSLRNRTVEQDDGRSTKLATVARYKFTLAFENSISPDYVTEKFFDPLLAGSVPVYLGAPNIADYAPGEHCYVNVADFAGPAELAAYLLHLHHDDREYARMLAWKTQPLRPAFVQMVAQTRLHPLCRLAALCASDRPHTPLARLRRAVSAIRKLESRR